MRDETLRNMLYKGHPPYCTCVECSKGRLTEKGTSDRTAIRREGGNKSFAGSRTKGAKKFSLFLLLLVCIAVVPYTGYLLYEHRINPLTGGAILLINISALLWNVSLLRKYRVGFGSLFAIFVFVALICSTVCAFAGMEPFAETKQRVIEFVGDIGLFRQPELDIKNVRFERGKLADEIVFLFSVSGTEKTIDGVVYTIEILGDGVVLGSTEISTVGGLPDFTPAAVLAQGPPIVRMLQDLDERYEGARTRRVEFRKRTSWEMVLEGKMFDYDWVKRTEEKLAELVDEENKWRVLRSGRSFSNSDIDRFCRRYVKISIRRGEG